MPSGRLHDRLTLWSLPWVSGVAWLVTRQGELTLLLGGGYLFSGLMFGPDLDIYSRQYQRWGILRSLWLPYRACFRHRSWLTHGPLLGTLVRVIYLGFFLTLAGLIILLLGHLFGLDSLQMGREVKRWLTELWQNHPFHLLALGVGLELGSLSHILADWVGSARKKKRR